MSALPGPDAYHVLRQVATRGRLNWFMKLVAAGDTRIKLIVVLATHYLFIFFHEKHGKR